MSLIWKKFRDGRDSSKTSRLSNRQAFDGFSHPAQSSDRPVPVASEGLDALPGQTLSFVTPAVERLFFPVLNPDVSDPLKAQPKFVLTLQQILDNLKTRRYFLSYLEGSPSQVLATFWIDVHNLQQCGLEILAEQTVDLPKQKAKPDVGLTSHYLETRASVAKTSGSCVQYDLDQTQDILDDRPKLNGLDGRETMQVQHTHGVSEFKPDKSKINMFISDISNANFGNLNANICDTQVDNIYSSNHNNRNKESNSNIPKVGIKPARHCDQIEQSSSDCHDHGNYANSDTAGRERNFLSDVNLNGGDCITNELNDNGTSNLPQECNDKEKNLSGEILQHLVKEVWRIFERYIAVDSDFKCPISEENKRKAREKINRLHLKFDPYCFKEAQEEAFSLLKSEVPGFLSSDYHLRHQLDLSYSNPTLPDMLYSQAAFPYFVEYLEQKRARPLLEFWMMASNFREQLEASTGHERPPSSSSVPGAADPGAPVASATAEQNQEDAMVIYDKYFSLQASHRLGFSDELRCSVEGNICQESGPNASCFDLAVRICLYILQTRFLPDYLRSSLYDSYVSDLLASVKNTAGERQRTASSSTCSSEVSSSAAAAASHNTLLAMDTSGFGRRPARAAALPSATTNMRIDARLISDPDSLWRRPNKGGLSCGSINPLGRFESLLLCGDQQVPARADPGKLAKTLRRLANRDDDKVRLEQAYSVAAAIVSDVTRVTLDARNSPATPYHPANPYDLANLRHPQHPLSSGSPAKPSHSPGKTSDDFVPPLLYSEYFKPAIMRCSNSNLSTTSNVSSTSDLPQSTLSSPAKSVMSIRKSSSNYNFSDITDGLFGQGSHGLAHSYSLASFDLATDLDAYFPDASAESEVHARKYSKT